jgi:hypothetical protein
MKSNEPEEAYEEYFDFLMDRVLPKMQKNI